VTDLHPVFLELLLAVLDGDDDRAHAIIDSVNAASLCHYTARHLIMFVAVDDRPEWREDLMRELLEDLPHYEW
jgi:hypothetical protein